MEARGDQVQQTWIDGWMDRLIRFVHVTTRSVLWQSSYWDVEVLDHNSGKLFHFAMFAYTCKVDHLLVRKSKYANYISFVPTNSIE